MAASMSASGRQRVGRHDKSDQRGENGKRHHARLEQRQQVFQRRPCEQKALAAKGFVGHRHAQCLSWTRYQRSQLRLQLQRARPGYRVVSVGPAAASIFNTSRSVSCGKSR
jgi:hypothetical protein